MNAISGISAANAAVSRYFNDEDGDDISEIKAPNSYLGPQHFKRNSIETILLQNTSPSTYQN